MADNAWDLGACTINCARCGLKSEGKCSGCRGSLDNHWSPDCTFLSCTKQKGLQYCFLCDDFPCEHVEAFENDNHEHHTVAVRNQKRIREIGLDAWLEEQPKVMFCSGWKF